MRSERRGRLSLSRRAERSPLSPVKRRLGFQQSARPGESCGCTTRGALSLKTAKEKSILRRTIDGTHTIGFSSSRSIHFCNKKNSTIFDLTTRTVPLKSTPKLGKKATHDGADSAIRRPPRSLSARRRRRNFWPGSAVCTARRPSARRCSRAPASTARRPPRWRAAPGERGERTGRPVAG